MDELHQAVAPFLHASGGGGSAGNQGGGGGGYGPFDLGVVGANDNAHQANIDGLEHNHSQARKEWGDLRSSREWRATERHFQLCEKRVGHIIEKTRSLYRAGGLGLQINDEADIRRGIDAYFTDLTDFASNEQRLRHIKQVQDCIGKQNSRIWLEIKRLIEF
jgi:hypothetical protein